MIWRQQYAGITASITHSACFIFYGRQVADRPFIQPVAAIFGGFSNKTVQPSVDAPGVKRLYIKGSAVFGGVEVKN